MPLYQHIIVALPKLSPEGLVTLCRRHTDLVLSKGGVVRSIENHGIRQLQERARRKYATLDGTRYFWEARFITSTFDLSPKGLIELDRFLRSDDGVLRYYTTKVESGLDRYNSRSFKNPYLPLKKTNLDNTELE